MERDSQTTVELDVRRHRALSSQVRRRLLELLGSNGGVDVRELSQRLGLHVNTVRAHLAVLEDAGLAVSEAEGRDRPGRPKLLYRITDAARDAEGGRSPGYRFLAGVLASYLASTDPDPSGSSEQAGAAWGHYLVDRPAPFQSVDPSVAVARVVDLLAEFGFAPELDAQDPGHPRVLLHRCPFLEVAREHQQVVCGIHLGLMRGAFEELGVEVVTRDLIPWAEPEVCVSHLDVPAETAPHVDAQTASS